MLDGMRASEILDLIDYDCKHNVKLGVFFDKLPSYCQFEDNLIIYSPDYVKWLEDKVEQLQPNAPRL